VRILVVEDDAINQTLTAKLLEQSGNEVVVAADGVRALEGYQAPKIRFDLNGYPDARDGWFGCHPAIRELEKATNYYTPIVMLLAHALQEDRDRSLRAGADGHVAKPIRLAELFEVIRVAIFSGHNPPGSSSRALLTH